MLYFKYLIHSHYAFLNYTEKRGHGQEASLMEMTPALTKSVLPSSHTVGYSAYHQLPSSVLLVVVTVYLYCGVGVLTT